VAFSSSFPAKIIDLGAVALVYVVEVTDVFKGVDYIEKTPLKSLKDCSVTVDWYSKTASFHRDLYEIGISCDYVSKTPLKRVVDVGVSSDYVRKDVLKSMMDAGFVSEVLNKDISKVLEFEAPSTGWVKIGRGKMFLESVKVSDYMCRDLAKAFIEFVVIRDGAYRLITVTLIDMVFGEHIPAKVFAKNFAEPPLTVVELKVLRGLLKPFVETITVVEVLRKELAKMFVERVFQEYWTSKGMSPALRDLSKMKDLLTKVAYKIAGMDVRRVYALPREWADIIESADHNVKIEICKALLEAMRRLKEKLGE